MWAKRDVKVFSAGIKPARKVNEEAVKAMPDIAAT